jgi:predicted enzyme related to lactoylglutathione lyase
VALIGKKGESSMASVISWFEIPVTDMNRAMTFYSTVLGVELQKSDMGGDPYTFFPGMMSDVSGALVQSAQSVPNDKGTTVYFSGGDDLAGSLSRVETAGGKIIVPKTSIGEGMGYFALFLDTEGNRVGLFSMH